MSRTDRTIEEIKVAGHELKETAKRLIHEGNVRRIIVKNSEGRVLLDLPLSAGLAGALLLPVLTAIAGIVALAKEFTVVVEARTRDVLVAKGPATTGYSGTPLAKKLGIKEASHVLLVGAPKELPKLLAPLPKSVSFENTRLEATDIVHVFSTKRADLAKRLATFRKSMRSDAMIWVSWPKKSSKVETDIIEDTIRELAFPLGLVDVKVWVVSDV